MLKTRIIPTLLYRDFGLVKGVRFDSRRAVGAAMQAIKVYNLRAVDELIFLDVGASLGGGPPDYALIDDLADDCFMPLTVGGAVRDVEAIGRLLAVGADKVALGSALVEEPGLVEDAASRFGSQCIVGVIDVARDELGRPYVHTHCGTKPTDLGPAELAVRSEQRGVGELLVQSIDRDGTMSGYDLDLIASISDSVDVPVIASGGAGTYGHMSQAIIEAGASAVAAASMFHFTQQTPLEAKEHLRARGVPVRK